MGGDNQIATWVGRAVALRRWWGQRASKQTSTAAAAPNMAQAVGRFALSETRYAFRLHRAWGFGSSAARLMAFDDPPCLELAASTGGNTQQAPLFHGDGGCARRRPKLYTLPATGSWPSRPMTLRSAPLARWVSLARQAVLALTQINRDYSVTVWPFSSSAAGQSTGLNSSGFQALFSCL